MVVTGLTAQWCGLSMTSPSTWQKRWHPDNRLVEVKTVPLNISDFTDQLLQEPGNPSNEITVVINEELWRVAGYETDTEKVVIRLQTPLDAVLANVPGRVITEELVGALPFESNV